MDKDVLNASVADSAKPRRPGVVPLQKKLDFLYVVIGVGVLVSAGLYSLVAGLRLWQTLIVLFGGLSVGWALLYSILEVRRLAQTAKEREEELLDPYFSRTVTIEPPTDDPCPHHEDYRESSGQDQGQRTSRLPGSTPLVDRILERGANKSR